jgi:hypothetical protein
VSTFMTHPAAFSRSWPRRRRSGQQTDGVQFTVVLKSAYSTFDGVPRTIISAVAVLDVLGFSSEIRKAHEEGRSNVLLKEVVSTFSSWYEVVRDSESFTSSRTKRFREFKAFTDNVVLGLPVHGGADEQTLAELLSSVAALQRGLALQGGFFARGGIAFGELYMDEDVVYGVALLDAHCAAESLALTPRIVISSSAASLLPNHARRYSPVSGSPQARYVLEDEDGELFVNYLADVLDSDDETPHYNWLQRHRDLLAERLNSFKHDSRVFAKYVWAARYHNYICSTIDGAEEYKLEQFIPALAPRRLESILA